MFRLYIKGEAIDFPANWSFFEDIRQSMQANKPDVVSLTPDTDDGLVRVFSQLWREIYEFTFVTYEGEVYFLAAPCSLNLKDWFQWREKSSFEKAA